MDEILLVLLRNGAHKDFINLTTIELGNIISMSQQNASRRLLILENEGLIEKRNNKIKITKTGMDLIMVEHLELKQLIEGEKFFFVGRAVRGLGEGKYYLSLKGYQEGIKDKLGFAPYPGTLNVKLEENEQLKRNYLKQREPVLVKGFSTNERTFGDIFVYPCLIGKTHCAIIIPLRTHHGTDILEIIAPVKLGKKIGEQVKIELL